MDNTVLCLKNCVKKDYSTHVYVAKGDHIIIKVYSNLLKSTATAALYFIIGMVTRCFEEEHDKQVEDLKERV